MATVVVEPSWDELHQPQLSPCRGTASHMASPNMQGLGTWLEPSAGQEAARAARSGTGIALQEQCGAWK